jgi:ribosomal protein L5
MIPKQTPILNKVMANLLNCNSLEDKKKLENTLEEVMQETAIEFAESNHEYDREKYFEYKKYLEIIKDLLYYP